MNIIQISKPGNSTIIGIAVPVGSRMESNNIKGISHFIEHMCFKGTINRTHKEIAFEIERYGGILNAFTDFEITCYYAKIDNKHKNIAIDVIKDLVLNPIFPAEEIDKEREVIRQELNRCQDNPSAYVGDLFNKKYFTKDSSFHLSVVGTNKSLNNINREEILKYYNKFYKEENMTLIIVGDIKSKDIYKNNNLINTFQDIKNTKLTKFYEKRSCISQANVVIGNYYKSKNPIKDYYSMVLLSSLYNDMSGRLFSEIREKHNLVYGINFYFELYSDNIIGWAVTLGLTKNKINKAYEIINKELTKPVYKDELKYAVTKAIGDSKLYFDSITNIMNVVAYDPKEYKEYLYNYEKHIKESAKNINQFIKKINLKDNKIIGVIPK